MSDGRARLAALKELAGGPAPAPCIPVGSPPIALLRVVATRGDRMSADDVSRLTEWRNKFVTAFLTEFRATDTQTAHWLLHHVGPSASKILFMVDDLDGRTFGYMGLDAIDWARGTGEADAIVRGGDAPRGAMAAALTTLLEWARTALGLRELRVRVRSDNPAVAFYEKIGFRETRRVALRRTEAPGKVTWVEDPKLPSDGLALVHMVHEPARVHA